MSYTFSITKDRYEPLLEIRVKEEVIECDPLVHSHLEKCFERVFQLIKKTITIVDEEEEKEEEEEEKEEKEEKEEEKKEGFLSIFN